MDAIETATQTEPGMPRGGIGTDRRRVGGQARDTERQRGRAVSPLRGQSARSEDRERDREREAKREAESGELGSGGRMRRWGGRPGWA